KSKRGHWPDDEKSEGEATEDVAPEINKTGDMTIWGLRGRELQELVDSYWDSLPENMQDELKTFYDGTDEGIVGTIGQGIDDLAVGAGKLAWKGAKKAAPHVKKGAKAGANMVGRGVKKGAKKLSKIGSKHTSYDPKTGKTTTTTGMANA
ncbi:uncharacterized protein METZ01_LOCUS454349, partial [marine metagenome]